MTESLLVHKFVDQQRIRREAYVWITLKHDNILTFYGIIDDFGLLPALVSPWMENGSLDSYLKQRHVPSKVEKLRMVGTVVSSKIRQALIRLQLRQMAAGLEYCTSVLFHV